MKKILRIEADQISCRKLTRKPYQMISIFSRLYRLDDALFVCDKQSTNCYIIYDLNGTQPYGANPEYLDPNMTRAFIDSAKLARTKKTMWGKLGGLDLWKLLAMIALIGSLAYGFMVYGVPGL